MPVWFSSLSCGWSKLRSKHFTTLFNNKHKSVLYILPYFPHWLLSVGFFLAPGRAEINNTNLILETSSEEQHLWVCCSHASSPLPAAGSSTQDTALVHPGSCTEGCECPSTRCLLAITVFLVSNLEEGKVYNNFYMITFRCRYLEGRLKLFSGLKIIFLCRCKA